MATASASTADGSLSRSPNSAANASSSKRNKPCQQCQKLKVKCERNPSGGPCQRCQAQNKECSYHEAPDKKRKRDTEERIDELEKTLESFKKSLGDYNPAPPPTSIGGISPGETGFRTSFGHPLDMLARTAANTHSPDLDRYPGGNAFNGITPSAHTMPRQLPSQIGPSETIQTTWATDLTGIDPVERGWIDIDDAKSLFERFWKHMLPNMPIISLGTPPNFEQIRHQEPVLFLSVIAAAASTFTIPDMFEKLHKEAISIITYNALVDGQKSSELLLSLLVLGFWPVAPARFDQLKIYLYSHMCLGMAIDLSLQRSTKEACKGMSSKLFPEEMEQSNRKDNFIRPLERERTWIAVYIQSVGFAVGMRRPHTVDWSPHHSYCYQALMESGQANDVRLARIARLLQISQDISRHLCYDNRPKSLSPPLLLKLKTLISELSDPSVYLAVKGYRQQLEIWREANPNPDEIVSIWYHHTNLFLHEVSLHSFHNTEDLRPPFGFNVRVELTPAISDPMVSAAHVDCISKVVYSAQKLLDHIFALHFRDDGESLIPNLPVVLFARSLYSWITLVRVSAVGTSVCDESSLRIEEYLERLGQVLDESASIAHFHTAMKFSWILRILKQCYKHKRGVPLPIRASDCPMVQYPVPQATLTPTTHTEPDGSASASTSTLPPLEPEFLAELDFTREQAGPQLNGAMFIGDGFDWDVIVNDSEWWNSVGGGWNDGMADEQSLR